uniref:Uncharacterized protein n=1 Tax=Odontella aurita TaxID=265563 RepID=A0A7S4IBT4_9STRA
MAVSSELPPKIILTRKILLLGCDPPDLSPSFAFVRMALNPEARIFPPPPPKGERRYHGGRRPRGDVSLSHRARRAPWTTNLLFSKTEVRTRKGGRLCVKERCLLFSPADIA